MPIKLVYERPDIHDEFSAVQKVEMTLDDERSLDEMLNAYKDFLLSVGFCFKGDLVVEEYDEGSESLLLDS